MSNQYMYSGDQAIIIQDAAIIWNDQSHDQSSLHYFDANDSVINASSNNESYVTAIDCNETQYLSILDQSDSNEITLEDLHNLTVENRDVSGPELTDNISPDMTVDTIQDENDKNDAGEVIVFTMDGSDDLYGIQLTRDEMGDIQKYQFKFRTTLDGQLEPIPESITLLPNNIQTVDQEAIDNLDSENVQTGETDEAQGQQYILVQAQLDSDNCNDAVAENNVQIDQLNIEHVYIKGECHSPDALVQEAAETEILQHCIDSVSQDTNLETHLENLCIKTEHYPDIEENKISICQEGDEAIEQLEPSEENHNEEFLSSAENEPNHEQLVQHFLSESNQIEVQYETELDSEERASEGCQYNQVYKCEENFTEYTDNYLEQTTENVNMESETGEYQIENGYTGEPLEVQEAPVVTAATEVIESYPESIGHKANSLKHSLPNPENDDKTRKPLVNVKYYVVYQEKENVNSLADNSMVQSQLPLPKLTKSNPRSVLRTSFASQKEKRQKLATSLLPDCDLYHKRFAKNKEAMRAKHFHNFLNRTTIPHAPIRQQRQPRKQEIKPVIERSDEEIIVQEVIVSSSGFVESLNKRVGNRKVQVTAVVELSDSEDDSNTQAKGNRRKTHQLLKNSSESELSIIEINSDNDESDVFKNGTNVVAKVTNHFRKSSIRSSSVTLKRRRGRPPKSKKVCFEAPLADVELSPSKRNRTDCDSLLSQCSNIVSSNTERQEITCPFCPKTFPSQNSLNTHIIHHNLENSLKSKAKMSSKPSLVTRKSLLPKLEYNHKCDECRETFKNSILLQKHNCLKKQTFFNCSVCLKQFRDITLLNIHKKSHAKSNLIKNTTNVTKISPKKALHKASTSVTKPTVAKAPKKGGTNSFKCTECPKICDSEDKLTAHMKWHKKFLCSSCSSTFSSKLLLDTHVRTNCVKVKPGNKRLSFIIKKSFVHTPPRRFSLSKPNETLLDNTSQSGLSLKLECDQCNQKCSTFRHLYTHKVQKHGLSTPDKSLLTKPKQRIFKPKAAHGGIPASDRLKKAYAALRKKLAESGDLFVT